MHSINVCRDIQIYRVVNLSCDHDYCATDHLQSWERPSTVYGNHMESL